MIVLGIADAHNIVRRQLQLLERRGEPGRLVDPRRQHHDRPLLKMICNSSQARGWFSDARPGAAPTSPRSILETETGSTFLAASLAMKLSDGGGAIARSSSLAGS